MAQENELVEELLELSEDSEVEDDFNKHVESIVRVTTNQ